MKKEFETPVVSVVDFHLESILCDSSNVNNQGQGNDDWEVGDGDDNWS